VALALLLPRTQTLLPGPADPVVLPAAIGLAGALVATQLARVELEIRQRTRSFSLIGLPLVIGLLLLPPLWVLAAQLAAALVDSRVQRTPAVRAVLTSAVHLFGTALVTTLLHGTLTLAPVLTVRVALVAILAVLVVDVLTTALLLLVQRIDIGRLDQADLAASFGPAAMTVVLATALGLLCVVLLQDGPVGWVLLGLVATGSATAYRGYMLLRRRHSDLSLVHGFIDSSGSSAHGDVVAADLLTGIREIVRAETARLVWRSREGEVQVHVSTRDTSRLLEPLLLPPTGTEGLVPATTTDPALRSWLDRMGAREAIVLELSRFGGTGLVVVTDPLGGNVARFTPDDLQLAGALAGHLVVRLRNTELIDRIRWEATHDAMTGLPNRRVLLSALELYLGPSHPPSRSKEHQAPQPRSGTQTAVLVMAVDCLGEIVDALGHAVGDEVVKEVARRLRDLGFPGGTVARLSGEQFAVAVPAVGPGGAQVLAERLRSTTDEPVVLPDAVIIAGARVGIATIVGGDGVDAAELLRRADAALAAARTSGRQLATYERSLDSGRTERLALLGDLHRALDEEVLTVCYQPKLDLVAGRVSGVEALVRWEHPVLGDVSPAVFVPLAESAGLVDRLTELVLAEALGWAAAWAADGLDLVVAVNLSTRSLDDVALPGRVSAALTRAGVHPGRLVLEITETSLMGEIERTLPVLHALAALGVGLSLDDFGTGYSSLAYLQRLPVHELKVDRSFIEALEDPTATGSVALVSSILSLAKGLGLTVVAEGVESARAMSILRGLGCGYVQGFLVSRPVPGAAVPGVVRAVEADPAWSNGFPSQRDRSTPAALRA